MFTKDSWLYDAPDKEYLFLAGGTDINPHIYKEPRYFNIDFPDYDRDDKCLTMIREALADHTPIIGVCRGAQLLAAYNGGKLYQHVEPRFSGKYETAHHGIVLVDHHQVIKCTGPDATVLDSYSNGEMKVPALVYYKRLNALGIQWHPEWMSSSSNLPLQNTIKELFNLDINFSNGYLNT